MSPRAGARSATRESMSSIATRGSPILLHAIGWHDADIAKALSQSAVFYLLAFGVRFVNSHEADILRSSFKVNFANTAL